MTLSSARRRGATAGLLALAAALVACGSRTGDLAIQGGDAAPPPDAGATYDASEADVTPVFPTGAFTCGSSISATLTYQGEHYEATGGGPGTLTLTQAGPVVTAAYTGDIFVSGTLRFVVTTDSSAEPAAPGQTITVMCLVGAQTSQPLAVASGSLTMDGTTLFLSFSGTVEPSGGACDGVTMPGTITCTR